MKKSMNKIVLFFTIYLLLMLSIILAVSLADFTPSKSTIEIPDTFKQELEKHEKKVQARQEESKKNRWNLSNETVLIAVSIGAVLDIIIVYIWVRRENRKNDDKERTGKKNWRDSKIFWNIVAMGVIQPKENKYVINWVNMIGVGIVVHCFCIFSLMKNNKSVFGLMVSQNIFYGHFHGINDRFFIVCS